MTNHSITLATAMLATFGVRSKADNAREFGRTVALAPRQQYTVKSVGQAVPGSISYSTRLSTGEAFGATCMAGDLARLDPFQNESTLDAEAAGFAASWATKSNNPWVTFPESEDSSSEIKPCDDLTCTVCGNADAF